VTDCFNDQRLVALLALAGPDNALELATRLDEDLSSIAATLTHADDPPVVRAQSHVLLAITGSIGADRLCDLARTLNAAAKADGVAQGSDLMTEILMLLNQLIAHIRTLRSGLVAA